MGSLPILLGNIWRPPFPTIHFAIRPGNPRLERLYPPQSDDYVFGPNQKGGNLHELFMKPFK